MNARYLLGIALATAAAVAACGGGAESGTLGPGGDDPAPTQGPGTTKPPGSPANPGDPAVPGTLPTNSAAGKDFFAKNLQPVFDTKCSGCHQAGGTGNPTWMVKADASKTYDMVYLQGFATATSRIVVKGVHSGGGAPELTAPEKNLFAQWIALEAKDGGTKTQTNVLEKFGNCFDKTKFDAINFGLLKTVRRQNGNNPTNQQENANQCTGCDNKPCSTCHAADDVTGFIMAIGNTNVSKDPSYTFEQTKKFDPPFIRQYVSTTPAGAPQYNPGVMSKSTNTVEKGLAYSHPMFKVTPAMEASIKAFVDDAITKYTAGTCGK